MRASTSSNASRAYHSENLLDSSAVIVPTCNAAPFWEEMKAGLDAQRLAPSQILIVDSSSSDNTQELAKKSGYRVKMIARDSFRHGATRQMAAELAPEAKLLVYLTQDAVLHGAGSLARLLDAFHDPQVGAAYGRQLPRPKARAIERHARLFNYPARSAVRDLASRKELGMRAAFFSNSFAAYRRTAFNEAGGFSRRSIVSEEVSVVARMLLNGWKVAYQGDATVIHSHALSLSEEFARYFDIGVHRGRETWLVEAFGSAGGEGVRFIRSEMQFLYQHDPVLLPVAFLRTFNKAFGYQLGKHEAYLPNFLKILLTAHPNYWHDEREQALMLKTQVSRP